MGVRSAVVAVLAGALMAAGCSMPAAIDAALDLTGFFTLAASALPCALVATLSAMTNAAARPTTPACVRWIRATKSPPCY